MSKAVKDQKEILDKLKIDHLNRMQKEAISAIHSKGDVVLLSPTGTGKTLAFLLPIVERLDPECTEIQALILTPSRELAIQIEQVTREMGTGFKNNAVYGGRKIFKDKVDLKHRPAILIGTPGRIADHIRRETFPTDKITFLVLDEFDKSLEIGFESEMTEIIEALPNLGKRILTSASQELEIPAFVGLKNPRYIDYLDEGISQLEIRKIISPSKDKLETLVKAICHIGNQPGIVFCNFKESIQRVSDYLEDHGIQHGCFHGGMEQMDRERALIKFRNGTHQLLLATDLAARGIDIPEIEFIVHYHLPNRSHEFIHRNGRTARMNREGVAYVLQWKDEALPEFIHDPEEEILQKAPVPSPSQWKTLFISGGRRDKISKGDIVGLFLQKGNLKKEYLGVIELKQDCAFVAVHVSQAYELARKMDKQRLKKKKVQVRVV